MHREINIVLCLRLCWWTGLVDAPWRSSAWEECAAVQSSWQWASHSRFVQPGVRAVTWAEPQIQLWGFPCNFSLLSSCAVSDCRFGRDSREASMWISSYTSYVSLKVGLKKLIDHIHIAITYQQQKRQWKVQIWRDMSPCFKVKRIWQLISCH